MAIKEVTFLRINTEEEKPYSFIKSLKIGTNLSTVVQEHFCYCNKRQESKKVLRSYRPRYLLVMRPTLKSIKPSKFLALIRGFCHILEF